MGRNVQTTAIIDGVLETLVVGGVLVSSLAVPGLAVALDKPLRLYLSSLDKRARDRELQRVETYMVRQGLLNSYEHGLQVTDKARERLNNRPYMLPTIKPTARWDKSWRVVLYDIPEFHKTGRDALTSSLKRIGFYQLQKSVWVYPYPCKAEVVDVASHYKIDGFVSYLVATKIANDGRIRQHFKQKSIL